MDKGRNGFGEADSGQIRINGEDYTHIPPHLRPVNTVFQRYALFPHLDVYENIAFGLKLQKVPAQEIDKRVRRVLKMVSMTDYEDRDVESLSGGQQQRVAIARAIGKSGSKEWGAGDRTAPDAYKRAIL